MLVRIFADKIDQDKYSGSQFVKDLQKTLDSLEYGDVRDKEFQIWEYPSGKMYDVVSDRELAGEEYKDYYGPPQPNVWLPKLEYTKTDKLLVRQEYERLKNSLEKPSLADRIRSFFRR